MLCRDRTLFFIGFVFPTNLHIAQGVPGVLKLGFVQLDDLKMGEHGWCIPTCMINLLNLGQLLVMLDFIFDSVH